MGSVLVLNSHARHGLETIRSLGAQGLHVTAGSAISLNPGRLSRFADRFVTYPSPDGDPDGFVRAVQRELERRDYDVLLPVNETTVATVVERRSAFEEHAVVPFPSHEKLQFGIDKRRTVEAAREAGVPQPKTLFSSDASLETVDRTLGYPLVIKPRWGSGRTGVSVCESYRELQREAPKIVDEHGPVLFQEYVPDGGERGVYTLYDSAGDPVGRTVQRRIRSRSPDGGASTYRETIEDPTIVEHTERLLSSLDWEGLAMTEFRIDARTGEPRLLEMNPRLWGSLALSTYAGVDFPYLLYRLAVGEDPDPVLDYEVGVRARCLFTDWLQVLERADRLTAIREFVAPSDKPCRFDVVSPRDPLPVLGQFGYWASVFLDGVADDQSDDERIRGPEVPVDQ